MPLHLRPGNRRAAVVAAALLATAPGCILHPTRFVAQRAPPPVDLAREAARAPAPPPAGPPAAAAQPAPRSLPDLVDLALQRDPTTRAAWHAARAAAANAGSRRGLYQPTVDLGVTLTRQRSVSPFGAAGQITTFELGTLAASASINWILLDLGGRAALVEQADLLATAARLAENSAVANLVLTVQQTYYQYLAARALVDSEQAAVKQAQTSLDAAEGRRRSGLATVAEVLQARTALSQVQLTLQQLEGQALALRGSLATLAGLPPTVPLEDVGSLPAQVDVAAAQPTIEDLLSAAAARNPDLARARALADAADAAARAASRVWAPVLGFQGTAGWTDYYEPNVGGRAPWIATIYLRIPTFQGLSPAYDYIAARANADGARATADATAQSVALQVWTSFQGVRTAARSVETSRDLVASAQSNAEVATGRYKEGVGSILDLLTAQAALEGARAQDVTARASFLVSLAQLARATGRLDLPPSAEAAPAPPKGQAPP